MIKLLTKGEVAKLLGCSERTVDVLRANEKLPFFKVGRQVRFNEEQIEKWLIERGNITVESKNES